MDFLKDLFNGGAVTFEDFAKAAAEKKVSAVNGAEHVKKADFDALTAQLAATNASVGDLQNKVKAFDGVDVNALKNAAQKVKEDYEGQLNTLKYSHALEKALSAAKARDFKSVSAHLDNDKIKLDGEKLLGLDSQIEDLKKSKSFLFEPDEPETTIAAKEHGAPLDAAGDAVSAFKIGAGLA